MASSSSRQLLCLAVALCVSVTLVQGAAPPCPRGGPAMQWLKDTEDCSKFYVCHAGRRFEFNCGENVWNPGTKSCVGKGSSWDKCTIPQELDKLNSCANSDSAVFAKADSCAQYYDCSSQEATVKEDPHVVECKFPTLFNPDTKRCEHYDMVKCGDRPEPQDACEYEANQCSRFSHCVPCNVRFPTCRGKPDGFNPWVGREYSPFYVLCLNGRAIYHSTCDNSKGTQLFHPETRVCYEPKPEDVV